MREAWLFTDGVRTVELCACRCYSVTYGSSTVTLPTPFSESLFLISAASSMSDGTSRT